jgi:hypothetical protein
VLDLSDDSLEKGGETMNQAMALYLEELGAVAAPGDEHFWLGVATGLSFGGGVLVGAIIFT